MTMNYIIITDQFLLLLLLNMGNKATTLSWLIDWLIINSIRKMSNIWWFQVLKYEDLLLFLVFYGRNFITFGLLGD